jgi:ribulose-phosphate 3-epimerase
VARFAPSLLSADFAALGEALDLCARAEADFVHVDVMDGHFVPNLTLGPPVIASLRKRSPLRFDVHLMIERPGEWVDRYCDAGADRLSFHVEAESHLRRTLGRIRERRVEAGVALNPATSLGALDEALPYLDFVLVMSVDPGFGGQSFLPGSLGKIRRLREMAMTGGFPIDISVDGGVDGVNAAPLRAAGADTLIAGNAFFRSADPIAFARAIRNAGQTVNA